MIEHQLDPGDLSAMVQKHKNFRVLTVIGVETVMLEIKEEDYKSKKEQEKDLRRLIELCEKSRTKYYLFCDDGEARKANE